jgi:RND family efflux transporter MFP subunit
MSRRTLVAAIAIGLALVGALCVQARGRSASALETSAALAQPQAPAGVRAEGRVSAYPGAEVVVGTDMSGVLRRVGVREEDTVRRGQLVAEVVADDLLAEIDEASARRAEAEAELRLADANLARARRLHDEGVLARQDLDQKTRDIETAAARLSTARAGLARLEATLAKARIVAPIAGTVVRRHADAGEALERGAAVLTIADLSRVRVEAEVDEYDAGRVRPGADVAVTAEGYEGRSWSGRVEEIPDTVSSRVLKPQDPGRPTDARVLLVKVALLEATPLKLGQRVEVTIAP